MRWERLGNDIKAVWFAKLSLIFFLLKKMLVSSGSGKEAFESITRKNIAHKCTLSVF